MSNPSEEIDIATGTHLPQRTRRALVAAIAGALAAAAVIVAAIAYFETSPSPEPLATPFERAAR